MSVGDRVRLVRLVSVASPDLRLRVGEVGTVEGVQLVAGRPKYKVCFPAGDWSSDVRCYHLLAGEVEAA